MKRKATMMTRTTTSTAVASFEEAVGSSSSSSSSSRYLSMMVLILALFCSSSRALDFHHHHPALRMRGRGGSAAAASAIRRQLGKNGNNRGGGGGDGNNNNGNGSSNNSSEPLPGPMNRYRLCATTPPNKCDGLVMRNTFEVWLQRQEEDNSTDPLPTLSVPVHFHSFKLTSMSPSEQSQQVPQATLHEFMNALYTAFHNMRFDFVFTTQTVNVNNDWYNCRDEREMMKVTKRQVYGVDPQSGKPNKAPPHHLHVWLCDTRQRQFVGQTRFPNLAQGKRKDLDGIMLMNPEISRPAADISNVDIYWSLVHQVGHWMGLLHPFTGACHAVVAENGRADGSTTTEAAKGDGVTDTPPQAEHLWFYPNAQQCFQDNSNNGNSQGQGNGVAGPPDTCPDVDALPDDATNYMQYLPDHCMRDYGHFTAEQILRMEALFEEYRQESNRRKKPPKGFQPNRRDLIDICLDEAIEACGCDTECLEQVSTDVVEMINVNAPRKTICTSAGSC